MLTEYDQIKEEQMLNELIESDENIRKQHDTFKAEMEFKQILINLRKTSKITQNELGKRTGLSQQAISRLERGQGATIETVIKYLMSMGYTLGIKKI